MWQSDPSKISNKIFSRRAFILLFIKILIITVIVIRLLILQIFKAKSYKTLSDKNRIKFIIIQPPRGLIKDANGEALAYNKEVYKVYFYKQKGQAVDAILKPVFDILDSPIKRRISLLKKAKSASYFQPIVIDDNASWDDISRIEAETYRLPGVFVEKAFTRYYPLKDTTAHILGYIGLPTKKESLLYELQHAKEAKIGKAGIERQLNQSLSGQFGAKRVEVNAHRIIIRDLSVEPCTPGIDVHLTINKDVQEYLYKLLPSSNSAAAVIEIPTGNILAMCSLPSFNPNLFSTEFDEAEWVRLMENKNSPFLNKVIGKAYPPGSAWKIVTSLAILEAGIDPEQTVLCNGSIQVGNRTFRCTHAHGYVNAYKALPLSCNCYFYKMGIKTGVENIYNVAKLLGYGQKIGIELDGEVPGINPNKQWKTNAVRDKWTLGDTANASIGQGFILTTPLQLLMMTARVASGRMICPSILKGHEKNAAISDLPFKQVNLDIVRTGLGSVMNDPSGTSFASRISDKRFQMAGKTGTAQVISKDTMGGKFSKSLRSHSIFTGYAPIYDPKYAVVVIADNAGWGAAAAAPIARDILLFVQRRN
jgi:penicillin-binding protein 2